MSNPRFHPDAVLLDIVAEYPAAEKVFRSYDEQAGECLLCNALFETVACVAGRYGLDLESLLHDLEQAAENAP